MGWVADMASRLADECPNSALEEVRITSGDVIASRAPLTL